MSQAREPRHRDFNELPNVIQVLVAKPQFHPDSLIPETSLFTTTLLLKVS